MGNKKIIFLLLLQAVLLMSGCGRSGSNADRSERNLSQIDSLLNVRDSAVRPMIDRGLSQAKDSMTWYEYYVCLAKLYCTSATPDSLLPVIARVEAYANSQQSSERQKQLLAYALSTRAVFYHNFHRNPNEVISLYDRTYNLLMQCENKSEVPKVVANLGDAYFFINDLPMSARCYRRALFLVDSLKLPQKENTTLYLGLAGIYQQLGDNDKALDLYKQTEKNMKNMSVSMQAYFLNNFGCYYYYIHDYQNALKKYLSLKRLLERHDMEKNFDMYLCKLNLADVYLNMDSINKSEQCLDAVEPYMSRHGDNVSQYYIHTIRIGIAVKRHLWDDVRRYNDIDGDSPDIPFSIKNIRTRYLRSYYVAKGDYKHAYDDMLQYDEYEDSLEHNRTNMRTSDIMAQFSADTLRLHADLRQEHQHAKLVYGRTVGTVAFGIAIIFGLLLIVVSQRSRKRILEARMKIMDMRLYSARSKISPHFVFNVLNNHMIAEDHDDNALLNLTKLIRQNLDMSGKIAVPLQEEITFIKRYVMAEKPVVGDDFDFQINISPDVDAGQFLVPSMLMQIMVENAIIHALSGWNGHKMLHIDVVKQPKSTKISVTDNGPGFKPDIVKSKSRTGFSIIRDTIAVINSRNRQKIVFGVSNVTDDGKVKGCQATLIIPDKLKLSHYKL